MALTMTDPESTGHLLPKDFVSVGFRIEKLEPDDDGQRRVQVYELDAAILVELLKPGPHCYIVVDPAMPEDARVVGSKYDSIYDRWKLAIQSKTFPTVPYNEHWPERPVIIAKILDHGTPDAIR